MSLKLGCSNAKCTLCELRRVQALHHQTFQRNFVDAHPSQCIVQRSFKGAGPSFSSLHHAAAAVSRQSIQCRGIGFDLGLIEPNRGKHHVPTNDKAWQSMSAD